jgi:penicillin-binding protein 1A
MQVARGYSVMANGGFLIDPYFITKIENDQGNVLFEARPKVACAECNIPVIYGDTPKSDVLENKDMENVAISQEQQNPSVPMPQLEQANQDLVVKSGGRSMHRTSSARRFRF